MSVTAVQFSSDTFTRAAPSGDLDALFGASQTGGQLNTRSLAEALSAVAIADPQGAETLFRAANDQLGPLDQARLAADVTALRAAPRAAPAAAVSDFKLDGATAADKKDLATSVKYLEKTTLGAEVIHRAEKEHVTIHIIHDGNDRALGKEIWWDPKSALVTTKGGIQSAALGLVHELAHTQANPKTPVKPLNNDYDNTEERRVIQKIETPIARLLGEGVRTDHRGDLKTVTDPTFHKPNPPSK